MALQDILAGRGVGVIDVHGDLYRELTWHLAALLPHRPELARRVVLIDPCQPDWTVSFNPLEPMPGLPQERVALFLTDIIVKMWKVDVTQSPRMVRLLTHSFLALSDLRLTLLELPRWLQDAKWRNGLLDQLSLEEVRHYFQREFPRSDKEARVWNAPVLNKAGGLVFDPDIKLMLSGKSKFDFRQALDRRLVVLAHLPKGTIGEGNSSLLGAFIVAQLQRAALARADSAYRPPFHLYLDEFQNYTTSHIQDVLAESRKYALALVCANQYLEQLGRELRSALINTTGTIICFRVGYHDARTLAPEIFPTPDFLVDPTNPSSSGWERLALELANLPPRHFWFRRRGPYLPVQQRTLTMPDLVLTPQLEASLSRLIELSGRRFGRRKSERSGRLAGIEVRQPQADKQKQQVKPVAESDTLALDGHTGNEPNHLRKETGGEEDYYDLWE
jgi:hypothetical protein